MTFIQQTPALFKPIKVGRLTLLHRVVHAPLTRYRAYASHVPGPHQASYYAQRSSTPGSLLIAEATLISHVAGGDEHVPGICTDAQIQGWKKITDAVHANGSYIFLQLWALGRVANPDVLENREPPSPYVPASAIPLSGCSVVPRALAEAEIQEYIADHATAARNAVCGAGFDGVEIHGAYGYLIDQFLQTTTNTRTDRWGGDEEGRTRFAREIVDAVVETVGPDRVGFRISPWYGDQDVKMSDPRPTFAYLATALRNKHPKLAYLHVVEPYKAARAENNNFLREIWSGGEGGEERIFISAGRYTRETALRAADCHKGELIAFGRLYITNPDLTIRLRLNLPLAATDKSKYYLIGNLTPFGYNDWPFADGTVRDIEGGHEPLRQDDG